MCRRTLLAACLLTACGRAHFDILTDAVVGGGSQGDGSQPVMPAVQFGSATPITELNSTMGDDDPTLSSDLLELYFDSSVAVANGDEYSATRASVTAMWSTPAIAAAISDGNDEEGIMLTRDDLSITLASDRLTPGGTLDLFISTRPARAAAWSAPTRIVELSTAANEQRLSMSADQLVGMFASDRSGGAGGSDLWATSRPSPAASWGTPVNVAELDTAAAEGDPCLDPSGLSVYFSATTVTGDLDLYVATRAARDMPFGPPVRLVGVNTSTDESDPWISADGRTLVFTRGVLASRDLFTATAL